MLKQQAAQHTDGEMERWRERMRERDGERGREKDGNGGEDVQSDKRKGRRGRERVRGRLHTTRGGRSYKRIARGKNE